MGNFIDLTGQKFGRLTVIKRGENIDNHAGWICQCECGNIVNVNGKYLREGKTTSCGCYHNELLRERSLTHGKTHTRLYRIWANIISRCCNSNVDCYEYYGGRGISICDEWKNNFENFYEWSINNGYNEQLTIDRINNDGNYEPSNCRWVTMKEQCKNRRKRRTKENGS